MRRRFAGRTSATTRWRLRCLPAFYVMEAPPLATPNLFTALSYHPKISVPQVPEPEYWNSHGPSKCQASSELHQCQDFDLDLVLKQLKHHVYCVNTAVLTAIKRAWLSGRTLVSGSVLSPWHMAYCFVLFDCTRPVADGWPLMWISRLL